MPELKCTVQTCVHNKQFLCDLDAIQVGGKSAKYAQDTCCDSFQERKESMSNSMTDGYSGSYGDVTSSNASPTSTIDCKAVDCKYNDHYACHAGKISVEGSQACHCNETECATFTCK